MRGLGSGAANLENMRVAPSGSRRRTLTIATFCLLLPIALAMSLRAHAQWRDFERARALYARADEELHHKHLPKAIEHLETVIQLCPDYLAAWDLLAHCYLESKQPDRAIEVLQEACRVHPKISQLRTTLGLVYVRLEQPEKAFEQFDAAMKLDPNDPLPVRLKGSLSEPAQSPVEGPEDGQHGEADQKPEHAQ